MLFRGDVLHAGAAYEEWHLRAHWYLLPQESAFMEAQRDPECWRREGRRGLAARSGSDSASSMPGSSGAKVRSPAPPTRPTRVLCSTKKARVKRSCHLPTFQIRLPKPQGVSIDRFACCRTSWWRRAERFARRRKHALPRGPRACAPLRGAGPERGLPSPSHGARRTSTAPIFPPLSPHVQPLLNGTTVVDKHHQNQNPVPPPTPPRPLSSTSLRTTTRPSRSTGRTLAAPAERRATAPTTPTPRRAFRRAPAMVCPTARTTRPAAPSPPVRFASATWRTTTKTRVPPSICSFPPCRMRTRMPTLPRARCSWPWSTMTSSRSTTTTCRRRSSS